MFRKRIKKQFPPGTFLPTTARIVAILHLCIAFTLILWYSSQPFMGRYFTVKSRMAIFETVFKDEHFSQLNENQKIALNEKYGELTKELDTSFWIKCLQSLNVLVNEIPTYEQAWLLLSVILPIYLLKRREGSWQAAWLLPILCFAFCVDNRFYGKGVVLTEEEKLFPTEAMIVAEYLDKPLSEDIFEQQTQLQAGWQKYLKEKWNNEFYFTVARAEKTELPETMIVNKRLSYFVLGLFMFWNVYFAWTFFLHRKSFEFQEIKSM